jgi:NAD(P)-dependent dehydrogenase (short-subunit alcohol dehydrogenase family)
MHTTFEGKVALVTGAAGGIGLATAKAFALAGASVVLADQNEKLLNEAAEKMRGEGYNALAVTCDVSDKAQVAAMIDLAVKTYGRLDAAFNNAGINCNATPMVETDDELFDRLINTNGMDGSRICLGCMGFGDAERGVTSGCLTKKAASRSSRKPSSLGSIFSIPQMYTRVEQARRSSDAV